MSTKKSKKKFISVGNLGLRAAIFLRFFLITEHQRRMICRLINSFKIMIL